MKAWKSVVTVLLVQALLAPALLSAASPPPLGRERSEVTAEWQSRLAEADQALQAGEWGKAKEILGSLVPEMCNRIESGEMAGRLLGLAVLFRAVAEAGLGNLRDARWDFGMAQALHPPFSEVDLTSYGEPGEFLDAWRYEPLEKERESSAARREVLVEAGVTAPRKVRAPAPRYPYAKRQACVEEVLFVGMIINEEGLPESPRLLAIQDPVLSFAAMDPLRSWRFEPARLGGKPVKVHYNLTVNFQVQSEQGSCR